jgi:hypothetical protein
MAWLPYTVEGFGVELFDKHDLLDHPWASLGHRSRAFLALEMAVVFRRAG